MTKTQTLKAKNIESMNRAYAAYNEAHEMIRKYSNSPAMQAAYQSQADNALKAATLFEKCAGLSK